MSGPIIRASIEAEARLKYAQGYGRDEHGYLHYELACINVWQAAWDAEHRKLRHLVVEVSPP
jgi:hypothetical protein